MSSHPFRPHNKWSQVAFGADDVSLDARTVLLVICLLADVLGVAEVSDELLAEKARLSLFDMREHRKTLLREGYLWIIDGSKPLVVYQVVGKSL